MVTENRSKAAFVRNNNVHITNICKNLCDFCGFRKKATDGDFISGIGLVLFGYKLLNAPT